MSVFESEFRYKNGVLNLEKRYKNAGFVVEFRYKILLWIIRITKLAMCKICTLLFTSVAVVANYATTEL